MAGFIRFFTIYAAGLNFDYKYFVIPMKSSVKLIARSRLLVSIVLLCSTAGVSMASNTENQKVVSANTGFAFKLLNQLAKDQSGKNIFISPFGVSTVLQMTGSGAGGQTRMEMQQVLGTTALPQTTLNEANRYIYQALNRTDTNNVLTIANALWYQMGAPAKPDFIACNRQYFGATIDALDFSSPHSVDVVNTWASEKTRGKISRIVSGPFDSNTRLYLANAVYFKGKWMEPFDKGSTKDRPFHLKSGEQKQVPMMEQSRKFTYRRGSGYQAVRLWYEGYSVAMYVFLPDPGSSPEKLLSIMNGDKWDRVTLPGFEDRDGTIVLPKFKLEYGVDLNQPLKTMGMKTAFESGSGRVDFSGISSRPLYISDVRQQTFIEVNEEGTEAAAATGMTILAGLETSPLPPPFKMIVDRPFLFLIADGQTGTILFMGTIYEPML